MAHPSNQNNNRKKYEIATDEVGNPIKQDEKKGKLREFKKGDIFFNYGCLPVSYYILLFPQHMLCFICSWRSVNLNNAFFCSECNAILLIGSQRTWEDPTFFHPDAEGCRGDNDPVDVCEIGMRIVQPGVSNYCIWSCFPLFYCFQPRSFTCHLNQKWI